jgi:hypothetical protein
MHRRCGGLIAATTLLLAHLNSAYAQTEQALTQARAQFASALVEEEHGDLSHALEKYRLVQAVGDTTPVRFRIASCLEGLGKLVEAREAFATVGAPGYRPTNEDAQIIAQSAARAKALEERVPSVTFEPSDKLDAEVRVDGAAAQSMLSPFLVNPGTHTFEYYRASSPHRTLTLDVPERSRTRMAIQFEKEPIAKPRPSEPTWPFIALIGGGTLLLGGIALLAVRENEITGIHAICGRGVCPLSEKASLEAKRSRALLFGPLGWIGLGVGAAALGIGLFGSFTHRQESVGIQVQGRFQ